MQRIAMKGRRVEKQGTEEGRRERESYEVEDYIVGGFKSTLH